MNTTNITINIDKICRSCLSEDRETTSIFNTVSPDNVSITDMLQSCALLQVDREDGLPHQICLQCCSVIHQTYEFKLQAQKSEAVIRSYLNDMGHNIKIVKIENLIQPEFTVINEEEYTIEDVPVMEELDQKIIVEDYQMQTDSIECKDDNFTFDCKTEDDDNDDNLHDDGETVEDTNKHKITKKDKTRCSRCLKKFKDEYMLSVHTVHCKIHECHICKKKFRTAGYLQNHLKKHDPKHVPEGKKFKCTECDKAYTSPANLTIHQYSHSGIKPYKCEFCGRGFTKMVALNSHQAIHTGNRSHLCSECGRGFTSTSILNQHKKTHLVRKSINRHCFVPNCTSGYKSNKEKVSLFAAPKDPEMLQRWTRAIGREDRILTFRESVCAKHFLQDDIITGWKSGEISFPYLTKRLAKTAIPTVFPVSGNKIAEHSQPSHSSKQYSFEISCMCSRVLPPIGNIELTLNNSLGERPFKCDQCTRSFTASGDLTIHLRSHTGEKPYLCPTCGRAFARITHLNTHIRTHTGERPYVCGECGKGFAQSGDLRSHERTHTGERPYACNICSKRFVQSSGLASHMATHSGIKAHVCHICSRAFSQTSSLMRHVKAHM